MTNLSKTMNELSVIVGVNEIVKAGPPREGLVPQSGDPEHPKHWVKPQDADQPKDEPKAETAPKANALTTAALKAHPTDFKTSKVVSSVLQKLGVPLSKRTSSQMVRGYSSTSTSGVTISSNTNSDELTVNWDHTSNSPTDSSKHAATEQMEKVKTALQDAGFKVDGATSGRMTVTPDYSNMTTDQLKGLYTPTIKAIREAADRRGMVEQGIRVHPERKVARWETAEINDLRQIEARLRARINVIKPIMVDKGVEFKKPGAKSTKKSMDELSVLIGVNEIVKAGPPREGLVPQSGDPERPGRWVLPESREEGRDTRAQGEDLADTADADEGSYNYSDRTSCEEHGHCYRDSETQPGVKVCGDCGDKYRND